MRAFRLPVIVTAMTLALAVGLPLVPAAASEQAAAAAAPTRKLTTSQLAAKMLTADEVRAATGLTEFEGFSAPDCTDYKGATATFTFCTSYSSYSELAGPIPPTVTRTGSVSVESHGTSKDATTRFSGLTKGVKKAAKTGKATVLVSKPDLLIYSRSSGTTTFADVVRVKGSNIIFTNCNSGTDASRKSCATKLSTAQAAKLP